VVESEQIKSMIGSGKNQLFFKTDKKPAVQYLLNYGIPVARK
jgi:hypothetical protein